MTKRDDIVQINGQDYRVIAVGVTSGDATYVHLISTTQGVTQKNGFRPKQCCGWLRGSTLSNNL